MAGREVDQELIARYRKHIEASFDRRFKQSLLHAKNGLQQRKQRLRVIEEQSGCKHRHVFTKMTGVAGMRMACGVVTYLCQYCQKEWIDDELPAHLAPPPDAIGGMRQTLVPEIDLAIREEKTQPYVKMRELDNDLQEKFSAYWEAKLEHSMAYAALATLKESNERREKKLDELYGEGLNADGTKRSV